MCLRLIFFHTKISQVEGIKIGAAFDSLMLLLGMGSITTILVMALAIWKGVLSGNLKTSFIRRKPLLVPSLVFTFTIIIAMIYAPIPMSAYHGVNQLQYQLYDFRDQRFRVYEPGAYEASVQVRVTLSVVSNEWLEVNAYFSQNDSVVNSLFINVTDDIIDTNGHVTQSLTLDPGLYDVSVNVTLFVDGVEQDETHATIVFNQPATAAFLPEITTWSSIRFMLGIACLFLVLGGICIGREDRTRRSEDDIDQEPPREGEVYGRRLGW